MADSDSESDLPAHNLTSFLFGNVDNEGCLEVDFLDSESKRHLSSLSKFGLDSFVNELIDHKATTKRQRDSSDSEDDDDEADSEPPTPPVSTENSQQQNSQTDYSNKSPSAIDYSDIAELAEEDNPYNSDDDYDADEDEDRSKQNDTTTDDEADSKLMPPPKTPSAVSSSPSKIKEDDSKKRLETPLAAMLPSKYANVDVREIFPDFRPDKVLRFSRLFGPGKPSSLPQIWRGVRKRRKKKKPVKEEAQPVSRFSFDSTVDDEEENELQLNFGPSPPPELVASDDEDTFLKPVEVAVETPKQEKGDANDLGRNAADWRFGPAQLWYDMLDVPENGENFEYGLRLKETKSEEPEKEKLEPVNYHSDSFLMVTQLHWEDDIIWNGDDIKQKVLQKMNSKNNAAGWVPSTLNRTAAFTQPVKGVMAPPPPIMSKTNPKGLGKNSLNMAPKDDNQDDTFYSIFPVENQELLYDTWEADIIWDVDNMERLPEPKLLTLDPNDENIILGIPDDVDPATIRRGNVPQPKVKIPHPHVKKSKILLGKAGVINVMEEDAPPPPSKEPDKDPFNISNDEYYMVKTETSVRVSAGGNLIQHSTPVVELRAPCIPTHMGPLKLRNFHRAPLKRFSHGALALPGPHPVVPLLKTIKKKAKQRETERIASGGGDVFFMRTFDDLTGKDGDLIVVEYCEEHPPLLMQVGMCTRIKNYYKRKAGKDAGPPNYVYGDTAYAHTSPFLGSLHPGQSMQVLENNMYRAPIYEHVIPPSDFLVIRTRSSYFIREIDGLFSAGQECPQYEVPGPNSKRANNFVRDFLQVFIYRLFWKSRDNPRRIKMDDIKKAFPSHSESSIRKRLKLCADFKRTGMDSNWWVIKPEFRLPTEEEIRAMVSPEQCCAYFSMIAAEQRLKDAGYGEKFFFAPQDDDDEDMQMKMEDEVKVAPWNTTRAYIQAMKGKCLLQLNGPADPTGCGEGFSYVRVPNKPQQSKEEQESQPKRTVTGTDADLRRLSLNNAKALLRKFGVPEEEIKKLSRWEVIDVVRTLSTEKAKAGEEGMTKFSRGNRFSIAEHQERYKEECQRIFDLQNRVLSSGEILSSDEGESTDEDSSDIEEMGKNIENMLANKKTSSQLSHEKEEQERRELQKMILGASESSQKSKTGDKKKDDDDSQSLPGGFSSQPGRVLKIYRTFRNPEGKEYTRVEIVRKAPIVDVYVKIRSTKDDAYIRQFATLDEHQKEEMKKEKRRIQEQLRRIKRNQEKDKILASSNQFNSPVSTPAASSALSSLFSTLSPLSKAAPSTPVSTPTTSTPSSKKKKAKLKPDLKLKCGACGQVGHMRTNKACPMYQATTPTPPVNVAMTEEQEEEIEKQMTLDDEDLVNVDGVKVKLSGKIIKHAEEIKRRSLVLKVPKDAVSNRKRRRAGTVTHCDYLKKQQKPANRRRTDPVVVFSGILERILNELRDLPNVQPFLFPVNSKSVPDYYNIIKNPMDLQTMRENVRMKKYHSREDFLADISKIVENSSKYNGAKSALTVTARNMMEVCANLLKEREDLLMCLEKGINPLLDDDQVALTYILENILNTRIRNMPESYPFHKPVNKKLVKDYYTVIKEPMDLETISKKVKGHKYQNRYDFQSDIDLIHHNSVLYNGADSPFTAKAKLMSTSCSSYFQEFDEHLTQLENKIRAAQDMALEQSEMDSLGTSLGHDDDIRAEQDASSSYQSGLADFGIPRVDVSGITHTESDAEMGGDHVGEMDEFDDDDDFDVDGVSPAKKKKDLLAEDLQFSSEEDEVAGNSVALAISASAGMYPGAGGPDDDSQQAAEAMVQLGNIGFYAQAAAEGVGADESMDVDPSYDPSDFLLDGLNAVKQSNQSRLTEIIKQDLEVSDSDEEEVKKPVPQEPPPSQDVDDESDLWF